MIGTDTREKRLKNESKKNIMAGIDTGVNIFGKCKDS